eukprot:gnl/TRDRNA2_/TRDRNA2_200467_c0_seq1.p1 gnl/TRDRNA2_/TRDRNA2_200467_c0~~gnl/TRDRNA2_/TRDRNA2_200467_c0_seq1.p1  ORF type:complete len:301 (-),score=20.25 gnl/TRDRNA2_/TRDRNA2_200467_c0_seq1:125-1027(-)
MSNSIIREISTRSLSEHAECTSVRAGSGMVCASIVFLVPGIWLVASSASGAAGKCITAEGETSKVETQQSGHSETCYITNVEIVAPDGTQQPCSILFTGLDCDGAHADLSSGAQLDCHLSDSPYYGQVCQGDGQSILGYVMGVFCVALASCALCCGMCLGYAGLKSAGAAGASGFNLEGASGAYYVGDEPPADPVSYSSTHKETQKLSQGSRPEPLADSVGYSTSHTETQTLSQGGPHKATKAQTGPQTATPPPPPSLLCPPPPSLPHGPTEAHASSERPAKAHRPSKNRNKNKVSPVDS